MASRALMTRVDWNKIINATHKIDLRKINKLKSHSDATKRCNPIKVEVPKIPASRLDALKLAIQKMIPVKDTSKTRTYGSPVTWKSVTIGGSVIVFTLGYLYKLKRDRQKQIDLNNKMTMGKADIKCLFDLVDTDGKKRTSDEFLGRWLLVYFGFTHCPDVCPEELEKLSEAIDRLHKDKFDVTPLFITVDPNRDKPALMRKYLDEFSKKWIGLTGNDEQIGHTAKSFRVYYSPGPKDQDNDYIVDHTIISYLIGPKGQLMEYFGQTKTVDDVENLIKSHIMLYKG